MLTDNNDGRLRDNGMGVGIMYEYIQTRKACINEESRVWRIQTGATIKCKTIASIRQHEQIQTNELPNADLTVRRGETDRTSMGTLGKV